MRLLIAVLTGNAGPVVRFVPVLSVAILFGLAMDHRFFPVSRRREAYTAATTQPTRPPQTRISIPVSGHPRAVFRADA